jgi:DNA topoisomerase-3
MEIRNFSPYPYYELTAVLSLGGGKQVKGRWLPGDAYLSNCHDGQRRMTDRESVYSLARTLGGTTGSITSVTKKTHTAAPPLPFSLSKLQMAASKKYDITDTLVHVQKLYEAGNVSYPRANCEYIPEGHFREAPKVIEAIRSGCPSLTDMLTGVDVSRKSPAWDDSKITEHFAIIPTARAPVDGALSQEERKIYELVCLRYALQFFPNYEYEETVVEFEAGGEVFKAAGRTVVNLGWQGWERQDERQNGEAEDTQAIQILPSVRQGESGTVQASVTEKTARPPKPYTYHSLLAAMNNIHLHVKDPQIKAKLKEIQGIGTPATQEAIISTLFERGYVKKEKKEIFPTELGKLLINLLTEGKGSILVHPDMTALWEARMNDIKDGAPLETFVAEVAGMVKEIISGELNIPADIPGIERRKEPVEEVMEAPCPLDCGRQARRYKGQYGYYWRCLCTPDKTFKDADGRPEAPQEREEAKCPVEKCKGTAVRFVRRSDGRPFWKCRKCGNFFDDMAGTPILRALPEKKPKERQK